MREDIERIESVTKKCDFKDVDGFMGDLTTYLVYLKDSEQGFRDVKLRLFGTYDPTDDTLKESRPFTTEDFFFSTGRLVLAFHLLVGLTFFSQTSASLIVRLS